MAYRVIRTNYGLPACVHRWDVRRNYLLLKSDRRRLQQQDDDSTRKQPWKDMQVALNLMLNPEDVDGMFSGERLL